LLTSLSLAGNWSNFDRPLQQALAQPLPLRQLHVAVGMPDRTPALNLVQLTQLEQLSTPQKLGHGSLLPQQLQRLQLGPYAHSSELIAVLAPQHLQQLQRVQLMDVQGKQVLLQLAQLPALQQLGLQYTSCEVAATTVAAWQHLPQLSELSLVGSLQSSVPRMRLIMAGVAAATSLNKLEVYVYMPMSELRAGYEGDSSSELGVALCSWLSGLPRLQELCLECETPLAPRDALALTSLTSLTRLALPRARGGVGDTRAAAVAASLSQLQHLDLRQCKLRSVAALAAIGQLKQLTELRLEGNSGITRQGVWQLTGLASLQQLGIDYSPKVDSAVLKRFWSLVYEQQ
jgi:Leucine-rich repeat (LRR) protein